LKYVLILFCLAASSLQALDYAGKWGVDLFGGANTQAMGDANKTLATVGGSIHNGFEWGLDATYGLGSNVQLALGAGEIYNSDKFNGGSIILPALSFSLGTNYMLPRFASNFDVGLGLGAEYEWLDGETSVDPSVIPAGHIDGWLGGGGGGGGGGGTTPSGGTYVVTECQGGGVGGMANLHARYFFTPNWDLLLLAGYRYAVVGHVIGTRNGFSEVEKEQVDYSGLVTRLCLGYIF
jgi:hypothetical protein